MSTTLDLFFSDFKPSSLELLNNFDFFLKFAIIR